LHYKGESLCKRLGKESRIRLGSVSIDLHKQERDYEHLNLSDENVVRYLLLYRSKIDLTYGISNNLNIYQSGDITGFNQELIALYSSLDNLIKKIKLKDKDRKFLELIFDGYEISDIIECYDYPRMTAYRTMDRIINEIIEMNELDWKEMIYLKGYADKDGSV